MINLLSEESASKNLVFILYKWISYEKFGPHLGVFSSEEELSKAVDFHIANNPNVTYLFEEVGIDRLTHDPIESHDWAYVPLTADPFDMSRGGMAIPHCKYWGKNIVGISWCDESSYDWFKNTK